MRKDPWAASSARLAKRSTHCFCPSGKNIVLSPTIIPHLAGYRVIILIALQQQQLGTVQKGNNTHGKCPCLHFQEARRFVISKIVMCRLCRLDGLCLAEAEQHWLFDVLIYSDDIVSSSKNQPNKKRLVSKQQFHFSVSGLILVKSSSNHDDDCCVTYHKRSYPENKTTSKKSDIQILCRDKHWRKKRVASSTPLWLRLISRRHLGPHLAAAGSRVQWHWLRKIYCNFSRYNPSPRFMVAPRHVVGFAV